MSAQFYTYTTPQCINGPRVTGGRGAVWDMAEATYLCGGSAADAGGFRTNDPFPGLPGFYIDTPPEVESVALNGYTVRLTGRGVKQKRVYSSRVSFTAAEQQADLVVGGVPYAPGRPAWPSVSLLLNEEGFNQVIVGATNMVGDVGQKVAAPQEGSFPPAPPNPWTEIATPKLNFPWGWILARRVAEPLIEGTYNASGPWILTLDYVYRWKLVPGG